MCYETHFSKMAKTKSSTPNQPQRQSGTKNFGDSNSHSLCKLPNYRSLLELLDDNTKQVGPEVGSEAVKKVHRKSGARRQRTGGSSIVSKQMEKTKICADFQHKQCTRGNQCPYAHGEGELRELPDLSKTRMCMLHIAGKCHKAGCKFAHTKEELRFTCEFPQYKTEVCRFHVAEGGRGCKYGNKCPYAHSTFELRNPSEAASIKVTADAKPAVPKAEITSTNVVTAAATIENITTNVDTAAINSENATVSSVFRNEITSQSMLDTEEDSDNASSSQLTYGVQCTSVSDFSQDEPIALAFPKSSSRNKRAVTLDPVEAPHSLKESKEKKVPTVFADAASIPVPVSPRLSPQPMENVQDEIQSWILKLQEAVLPQDVLRVLKLVVALFTPEVEQPHRKDPLVIKDPFCLARIQESCNATEIDKDAYLSKRSLGPPPGFEDLLKNSKYSSTHFLAERAQRDFKKFERGKDNAEVSAQKYQKSKETRLSVFGVHKPGTRILSSRG